MTNTYHHGNLRAEMVDIAIDLLASSSDTAASLREVARRAGVSHGAAAHHFGDKRGLWTAVAAEGFRRLTSAMRDPGEDFLEVAVEYVRFALGAPRLYSLMFDGAGLDVAAPELVEARGEAGEILRAGVANRPQAAVRFDPAGAELAAFALVHGLATLFISGFVATPEDPAELSRRVALVLFPR